MTHRRTKTSFYRRLYVAYLIDHGVHTAPAIINATGMPKGTAQATIMGLTDIDIVCEFIGATKNGNYVILDWGPIKKSWVKDNLHIIKDMLEYP